MADSSSIADRMQKLAQLKRRKSGEHVDDDPVSKNESMATEKSWGLEEEEAAILMPGPVAETYDEPSALDDIAQEDESSFAPELGASASSITEETPETTPQAKDTGEPNLVEEDAVPEATSTRPQTEDTGGESLEDYFAALGMSDKTNTLSETGASAEIADTQVDVAQESEADDVLSEINLSVDEEPEDDLESILAAAEASEAGLDVPAADVDEQVTPDFTATEIDPEILAREFEHEAVAESITGSQDRDETIDPSATAAPTDGESALSITFDESRSTLLAHVSRQMNCSVDDVVVTALDWYLDALFGDDEHKLEATG